MVKEEASHMDSSADSSYQIDEPADYSAQLYALYHSRRNLPADDDVSATAEAQMNGLFSCVYLQLEKKFELLFAVCLIVAFLLF